MRRTQQPIDEVNITRALAMDEVARTVQGGLAYVADIEQRLASYFARAEPRQRAMTYLRGLLSPAERKNSWQLAEISGDATPYGFQHLLGRADWEADAVCGELRRYLMQHLGESDAVLVLDETGFLKKGRHSAGVPAKWVTGDSVYGADRRLRQWLEARPHAYVLAVSGKEYVWLGWRQRQVKTILAALPANGWARLSAGEGTKGPRWYDWRWRPLADPVDPTWRRWLLVRRSCSTPTELTAYVVFAPQGTTLAELVRVAGTRWTVESGFEEAKGEVGLDQYEVRSWTAWYRHITLAMWALALLTVLRAGAIAVEALKKNLPPAQERSSLAAFKAQRGLASR